MIKAQAGDSRLVRRVWRRRMTPRLATAISLPRASSLVESVGVQGS